MSDPASLPGSNLERMAPSGAVPVAMRTILVADDEDGTLTLFVAALTYGGFSVIAARDGLEALVRAREQKPDLALLDVMMPGMDGRDVCQRMRTDAALRDVPVILHSAADEHGIDWRACGAQGFLAKPFTIGALFSMVRDHLAPRGGSAIAISPPL